jgi:hypothetical protein
VSDESLEFIKAITHGDIPKLKALAPLHAAKLSKNYQNLMHNIGHGLGHPENHEVLTILHDYVGQGHLMDAIEGAIDGDNTQSYDFLIKSPKLDISKAPKLLVKALGMEYFRSAAMLLCHNVKINNDMDSLMDGGWDYAIDEIVKFIPQNRLNTDYSWFNCIPAINDQRLDDFLWSSKSLDVNKIPSNLVNLIKDVGNAEISMALIEKGFAFDDLSIGYNKDRLPEMESKYLELIIRKKLSKPTIIHAPKINL